MKRWSVHRWTVPIMALIAVTSATTWWATRERLPRELRIATAIKGGLYHEFATVLADLIEKRTGSVVVLRDSMGSLENGHLLLEGEVDLAILQATALQSHEDLRLSDLAVLAPLYPEVVHVVVRKELGITSVAELVGKNVSIGPEGSGMRESAKHLLVHYRTDVDELGSNDVYFMELESDSTLDAAVVTTGLDNPDLNRLLATGRYELLPILDAEAIDLRNPFFRPFTIPRGYFYERPALPPEDVLTIATTSVLAARKDCGSLLVQEALGALYGTDLRPQFPQLFSERDALASAPVPVHNAARSYLDPYEKLGVITSFIESLAGLKELLVGVVALGYLIWDQLRRMEGREREKILSQQKEKLDTYLERTVTIERAQMDTTDPRDLRGHLRELTLLKIQAIGELTEEDLRGDRMFQIFLMQCAYVSRKIQARLDFHTRFGEV
ncbi:MAG: TAXI family TRAP transporter solute-binding subunit [bacterium]|nr:TAXI family TRAP transporter solute-binding subunit [bacterium]